MITKDNLAEVLDNLGFVNSDDVYTKSFPQFGLCTLSADFKNKQLQYPEALGLKINDRTTCNFEHPENFVVFECVNRLLEKGYRPEHIELEKRWNLGHDAKGGKADICVYDKDGENMLLIIECKTAGAEHSKALKLLKEDGGQVFSYWQQERSTKWLSLYASDFKDGEVSFENYIINCSDDENVKKLASKDKTIRLYENAQTVKDLFEVWEETYDKYIHEKGVIFGEDSQAYQIGVPPLRKKRLEDFKPEDKIVNRFEEILRHNNVSDKENAFNRLVALFICKLVDETQKSDNDIVEFQYKVGTDTYESLQDRLQRLHKEGMEKFMGEEIFYVSDDYAENLFAQKFNDAKRKAAIEDLKNTIRILKFYSNNDFAFKDVHNEELFFQNGKILVEVVQLFQKYRIVYPSKHQFLGDLFEQLLNKGFKQNEGQFFTPTPITRFIWDCLPMDKIVRRDENFVFPKVIDYACGAGHFLTEAVEAINAYFHANNNSEATKENLWCEHHIFGVEKDYRLARVAKVSLYMNGAGQGKIKFGDGLEQYPDEKITNTTFDVLVANPPYSVSGFKAHLKLKNNQFELINRNLISNDGSEIETLFVERIAQLLKPQGIAAVILPSSILSNDSNSYMTAREILLQNFYLRAVAQFGSKTFGATGTNTVVLFLEKYNEPPKKREIVKDCVAAILSGDFTDEWEDAEVFRNYILKIGVDAELYQSFTKETATKEELQQSEYFAQYLTWFENLTEVQNKRKSNKFNKLSENEQQIELKELFFKTIKAVESEKLTYFALVYNQTTLTIIAPADNAEQKKFLGYDWSNRKGAEGIQINQRGGMLYNDADRYANDTLAAAVRNSFSDKHIPLPENVANYHAFLRTHDMLDFSRTTFNKAIKLTADKKIEIVSKYPLVKLGDNVFIVRGVSFDKQDQIQEESRNIVLTADNITLDGHFKVVKKIFISESISFDNEKKLKADDCFMCFSSGSKQHVGKVAFIKEDQPYFAGGFMGILRTKNKKLLPKYLFETLNNETMRDVMRSNSSGTNIQNLSNKISEIKIPLPSLDIQQQIVSECEKVDKEYNTSRMSIDEYEKKIAEVFERLQKKSGIKFKELQNLLVGINGDKTKIAENQIMQQGKYPVITQESDRLVAGYTNDENVINDLPIIVFGDHSCTFKYVDFPFVRGADGTQLLKVDKTIIIPKFLYDYLLTIQIENAGKYERHYKYLKQAKIPLPSLAEQQRIVSEIEQYEKEIAKAKAVMAGCAERKKQILEKYLN